jgi:hypothetical protein
MAVELFFRLWYWSLVFLGSVLEGVPYGFQKVHTGSGEASGGRPGLEPPYC